jgi:hypothetical protein
MATMDAVWDALAPVIDLDRCDIVGALILCKYFPSLGRRALASLVFRLQNDPDPKSTTDWIFRRLTYIDRSVVIRIVTHVPWEIMDICLKSWMFSSLMIDQNVAAAAENPDARVLKVPTLHSHHQSEWIPSSSLATEQRTRGKEKNTGNKKQNVN